MIFPKREKVRIPTLSGEWLTIRQAVRRANKAKREAKAAALKEKAA